MVPFQLLIKTSSPSSNPYEHEPSPMPFSPFSSSSSRRKFLGTVCCFQYEVNALAVKLTFGGHDENNKDSPLVESQLMLTLGVKASLPVTPRDVT